MRTYLAVVALIALASGSQSWAMQAGAAPSWQSRRSDRHDPLLNVRAAGNSGCTYLWDGRPVAESELIQRGANFLKAVVARIGPANVTMENMPVAKLQFNGDVPYRCVRLTIEASAMMGFAEVRIDNPRPGAEPWVQPLVFTVDFAIPARSQIDPVRNRVHLDGRGTVFWNGTRVDLITLRQYCDLTQQMNPVPLLTLGVDEAVPYRQVSPLLAVIWRSHARSIEFDTRGAADGRRNVIMLRAGSLVR